MYFDNVALNWDSDSKLKRAKILSDKILEEIPQTSDFCALDFGCGTGMMALCLSESFNEIICTDLSEKMLEVLSNKLASSDFSNIKAIPVKELYNSQSDKKFDLIYSSMVFHHIVDTEKELKKLYELLNENGSLIIIDLDIVDESFHSDCPDFDGHNGFDRQELIDIFNKCGFKNINIKTVFEGQKPMENGNTDFTLFLLKGNK